MKIKKLATDTGKFILFIPEYSTMITSEGDINFNTQLECKNWDDWTMSDEITPFLFTFIKQSIDHKISLIESKKKIFDAIQRNAPINEREKIHIAIMDLNQEIHSLRKMLIKKEEQKKNA